MAAVSKAQLPVAPAKQMILCALSDQSKPQAMLSTCWSQITPTVSGEHSSLIKQ